ncbi:MAG: hypothetical protein AAGG02_15470 [Cyanobacteria bacterium P01_H01_bin.15]
MMLTLFFPLLLLITAIICGIWFRNTAHEIFGLLAGLFAIACLVWLLVISHWTFQAISLTMLYFFHRPLQRWVTFALGR